MSQVKKHQGRTPGWQGESGGGVYSCHAWLSSYGHRPSHLYNAETNQAWVYAGVGKGFSPLVSLCDSPCG